MKKIIKVLLVSLITIVSISMGGCVLQKYMIKRREKKVVKHMEEKYDDLGDAFTVVSSSKMNWSLEVYMNSKKYPDKIICASYFYNNKNIIDNYMAYIFQEDIEEAYKEIFDKVYGEGNYKATNNPNIILSQDYNLDTPFEEYLNTIYENHFSIICTGDPNHKDEKIEEILNEIVDRNWGIDLDICYVDASYKDKLDTITFDDINNDKAYTFRGGLTLHKGRGYENAIKYYWIEGR